MLIGVDTGGTFTDLVLWDGATLQAHKVPSTPADFSSGVLRGIREIRAGRRAPFDVVHAATVATNALLERTGARTALITTQGFRDVLEIGRQTRPALYDLFSVRAAPLVPRRLRLEVAERVDAAGQVLIPLKKSQIQRALDSVMRQGIESLAICLLFSFRYPRHEKMIAALARRRGLAVSVSGDISAEFREYERTSTTVINAYVSPVMQGYIGRLDVSLRQCGARTWRVMQSNGGSLTPRSAGRRAVNTLLSGPAAGVVGALAVARQALSASASQVKVMTFDMGGTSTDVSLIAGDARVTTEGDVAGLPVRIPMIDIHTVGAGGGSIARLDPGGALGVGPQSAGADPGPACYGRADEVTVTDANLLLGRIEPAHFLGGRLSLDVQRARQAMRRLARSMGTTPRAAAQDIVRIVNANMERALRVISIERGHDPRDFTLVCFGGAGGLHACALAAALRMRQVLVPHNLGVLSAWGALVSDVTRDYSRTVMLPVGTAGLKRLTHILGQLERQARRELRRETPGTSKLILTRSLDMRYLGQSYELNVPFSGSLNQAARRFHAEHARRYGHCDLQLDVEIVTARLRGIQLLDKPTPTPTRRAGGVKNSALVARKKDTVIYDRTQLRASHRMSGPALIVEPFASTWLPPGWRGRIDRWGNLRLSAGP